MRAITIRGNETTILGIVPSNIVKGLFDATVTIIDNEGNETYKDVKYTNSLTVKGNLNNSRAAKKFQAKYGKNSMVVGTYITTGTKLSLDADIFRAHSFVIKENETTTHDIVTALFKETIVNVMQIDLTTFEQKETELVFADVTTENKLLNFVRHTLKDDNAIILGSHIVTIRRGMEKTKFETLALKYGKTVNDENNDNDNNDNS